jgi:sulfatase maturation enzyme AslB (radical SAM superfamily)
MLHRTDKNWLETSAGEPRGYIEPSGIKELWFHTGTACNLRCPDCYEHSQPGDRRLEMVTFVDVKPFIDEAVEMGVEQFSFTGGEPFVIKDIVRILDYALDFCPCLVLTNGTLQTHFSELFPMVGKPGKLSFRISLDFPDIGKHNELRGDGTFETSLETLNELYSAGFHVSVARRSEEGEDSAAVDAAYRPFFESVGLLADIPIVRFPNLSVEPEPLTKADGKIGTPEITETCMNTNHTSESYKGFMCAFSRMVVKKEGQMRVYACTLVDDHPHYDLGSSLKEASDVRVMLCHPRCYACFSGGTSCSEL